MVSAPVLNDQGQPVRTESGDVLTHVLEDKVPKLAAIATVIRVMERRAKYLGLDAPVKATVNVTNQPEPQDLSHLSVEDLEAIKNKIYGGQRLLASTQKEGTEQ